MWAGRGGNARVRTQSKSGKKGTEYLEEGEWEQQRIPSLPFPPRSSYPASSHWKGLCGRGWAFCLHPPATAGGPNTPGNVTGSLPPGTTGSHRLPGLTGAHLCKRAGQSPAGQKLGVNHSNKSMQAHTSPFPLVLTAGPSTLPDTISISPHVPCPYPVPPYPGLISQVICSHSQLSAPTSLWRMQLGAKCSADKIITACRDNLTLMI